MARIEYNQGIELKVDEDKNRREKEKKALPSTEPNRLIYEYIKKEMRTCIVYCRARIRFGTVHTGLCTLYMPPI